MPIPPPTTACSGFWKPTEADNLLTQPLTPFRLQPEESPWNNRQRRLPGLGSAIGAGLFIGSGAGIQAAGPAVLISYLVAGTLIILVMWALGEMAAANPDSGAFSVYTAKA